MPSPWSQKEKVFVRRLIERSSGRMRYLFLVLPSPERCGNQSPSVRVRRCIVRAVRNVSPRRVITVEHIGRTVV